MLLSNEIPIKKISCGYCHSLLLSSDGDIYLLGWIGFELKHKIPKKLIDRNKFIDIASHYSHMISIGLSVNNIYYVWGKTEKENLREPKQIVFKSFNEIFDHYFGITHKVFEIKVEKQQTECNSLTKFLKQKSKTDAESEELTNRFLNNRYKSEFEELKFIGRGGFGKVYKVVNCLDQQQYAIKIITIEGISLHYFRNFFQCI